MPALPNSAALTMPTGCSLPSACRAGNGARCALTATGPDARAAAAVRNAERLVQVQMRDVRAERPGLASPTSAFRLAPSVYTCPPCAWTVCADLDDALPRRHRASMGRSPSAPLAWRECSLSLGIADRRRRHCRCGRSLPAPPPCPHICADAGLVPCALSGIRQMLRWPSPRDRWYSRMASSPAYSPCAPEFGCRLTAS